MKKLLRTIALLLLPILLYYCVFLAFEPNNYFGLRATTPSGAVFGALREYKNSPQSSVILGDSRLAHFSVEALESETGRGWSNLSFGGASLKEELDMLDWLLKEYPEVDEVLFGLSFYTLNQNYGQDRWKGIEEATKNPLLYLTNLSFNISMLQDLTAWLQGGELGGGESETEDPATYTWSSYTYAGADGESWTLTLRDTVGSHLNDMLGYLNRWQLDETEFDRLLQTIEECTAKGIRFTVVLPPMHPGTAELIKLIGITGAMQPVLDSLDGSGATVLDYEFHDAPDWAEDMYYDGLHVDYERGLPEFVRLLGEELR